MARETIPLPSASAPDTGRSTVFIPYSDDAHATQSISVARGNYAYFPPAYPASDELGGGLSLDQSIPSMPTEIIQGGGSLASPMDIDERNRKGRSPVVSILHYAPYHTPITSLPRLEVVDSDQAMRDFSFARSLDRREMLLFHPLLQEEDIDVETIYSIVEPMAYAAYGDTEVYDDWHTQFTLCNAIRGLQKFAPDALTFYDLMQEALDYGLAVFPDQYDDIQAWYQQASQLGRDLYSNSHWERVLAHRQNERRQVA